MTNTTIEQLLERYFKGDTSLQEEAQLREYFAQAEVPAQWQQYQPLFQYYEVAKAEASSPQLNERLQRKPAAKLRRMNRWTKWAAAAVLVLGLGTWWIYTTITPTESTTTAAIDWSKYEPQSEEEAMLAIAKAFRKTSGALRRSVEVAEQEMEAVGKLTNPF